MQKWREIAKFHAARRKTEIIYEKIRKILQAPVASPGDYC
jgi:hypothetical protein